MCDFFVWHSIIGDHLVAYHCSKRSWFRVKKFFEVPRELKKKHARGRTTPNNRFASILHLTRSMSSPYRVGLLFALPSVVRSYDLSEVFALLHSVFPATRTQSQWFHAYFNPLRRPDEPGRFRSVSRNQNHRTGFGWNVFFDAIASVSSARLDNAPSSGIFLRVLSVSQHSTALLRNVSPVKFVNPFITPPITLSKTNSPWRSVGKRVRNVCFFVQPMVTTSIERCVVLYRWNRTRVRGSNYVRPAMARSKTTATVVLISIKTPETHKGNRTPVVFSIGCTRTSFAVLYSGTELVRKFGWPVTFSQV